MGVILTMTMVLMTGLAMTRERERGTMENLLATPAPPLEVMTGKIVPYIADRPRAGVADPAARALPVRRADAWAASRVLFAAVLLFIAANLTLGLTFSSLARNQLQAMQMTFFFFLPSILLSGFMFPFRGMPELGAGDRRGAAADALPAHRPRLLLKGNGWFDVMPEIWPIAAFMFAVVAIGLASSAARWTEPARRATGGGRRRDRARLL